MGEFRKGSFFFLFYFVCWLCVCFFLCFVYEYNVSLIFSLLVVFFCFVLFGFSFYRDVPLGEIRFLMV